MPGRASKGICFLLTVMFCLGVLATLPANEKALAQVRELEQQRIAVIDKVRPSVVAVFAEGGQGGGSGVLINAEGYALTNWHVVSSSGMVMQCGLPDGELYDAVLVGLDKVGDVALIKLLPRSDGQKFPAAIMGDSDKVRAGDWSLALGNPFLLATDFQPTVTYGLVSGTHRYQYPESSRGLLEYTDCIQVDTSINPGNSGGPLFNMKGELIGINGRISLQKRQRLNSGVGYAISINQIKNFLGHLKAGIDTDHASTAFMVESETEEGVGGRLLVRDILENSDAYRRGIERDDELVSFAGRQMTSVNQYKNVLGIFPKGWRVPMIYRRNNEKHEVLVRLTGVLRAEEDEQRPRRPMQPQPEERQEPKPTPKKDSPAKKFVEEKSGYANYWFNRHERDRLWNAFRKHGDFSPLTGSWQIEGELETRQQRLECRITLVEEKDAEKKADRLMVRLLLGGVKYELDPLRAGQSLQNLKDPPASGGLMLALYQYRRLLTLGEKGFEGSFVHGGQEPFYPSPQGGAARSFAEMRVDTEVLRTEHASIGTAWHFRPEDGSLLGFELTTDPNDDPCEVYCADYRPVEGRSLPHRLEVRYGNGRFGILHVKKYDLKPAS